MQFPPDLTPVTLCGLHFATRGRYIYTCMHFHSNLKAKVVFNIIMANFGMFRGIYLEPLHFAHEQPERMILDRCYNHRRLIYTKWYQFL